MAGNPALRAYYRERGYTERGQVDEVMPGRMPVMRFEKLLVGETART